MAPYAVMEATTIEQFGKIPRVDAIAGQGLRGTEDRTTAFITAQEPILASHGTSFVWGSVGVGADQDWARSRALVMDIKELPLLDRVLVRTLYVFCLLSIGLAAYAVSKSEWGGGTIFACIGIVALFASVLHRVRD